MCSSGRVAPAVREILRSQALAPSNPHLSVLSAATVRMTQLHVCDSGVCPNVLPKPVTALRQAYRYSQPSPAASLWQPLATLRGMFRPQAAWLGTALQAATWTHTRAIRGLKRLKLPNLVQHKQPTPQQTWEDFWRMLLFRPA